VSALRATIDHMCGTTRMTVTKAQFPVDAVAGKQDIEPHAQTG